MDKSWAFPAIIILGLLLAPISSHLLLSAEAAATTTAPSGGGGWLPGWQYRRPITVDSKTFLKDYQLRIVIDTASLVAEGKLRGDCGDLRFTLSDGMTQVPYWVESGCGTRSTVAWLRIPELNPGQPLTLYMYYGNPAAESKSSAWDVFLFYDDFDYDRGWRTSYAEYRLTSILGESVIEVRMTDNTMNNVVYLPVKLPCDIIVEWRAVQPKYVARDQFGVTVFDANGLDKETGRPYNGYIAWVDPDASEAGVTADYKAEHSIVATYNGDVGATEWHKYTFTVTCNGYLEFRSDKGWKASTFTDFRYTAFAYLGLWLDTESYDHPVYYDWIRVRRYSPSEPTVVFGPEGTIVTTTRPPTTTTTTCAPSTTTVTVVKTVYQWLTSTVTSTATSTTTHTLTTTVVKEERGPTTTVTLAQTTWLTTTATTTSTTTITRPSTVTVTATSTVTRVSPANPSPYSLLLALAVLGTGFACLLRRPR